MSIYIILYIIVITSLMLIGFISLKKYGKLLYGKFLFLSVIIYSLWLFFYLISFISTYDKDILLILSRLLYGLSLLSIYFILLFILNFGNKYKKITDSKISLVTVLFLLGLFLISLFTPYIIKEMIYESNLEIYYEGFGGLYYIYTLLYLIQFPLFLIIGFLKFKELKSINKIRFKYLFTGFGFLLFNVILFLAILPIFGIWIMQKEVVLFFIPLVTLIWYVIYRYNFLNIKLLLGKIINFIFSLSMSVFFVTIGRYYLNNILDNRLVGFWGISNQFGIIDLLLGVTIFVIIHTLFNNIILGELGYIQFTKQISKIKKKIAFISTLYSLNKYLDGEFKDLIKSRYIKVVNQKGNNLKGLKDYFYKNKSYNIFINDIVFIEENKNKFDFDLIETEISKQTYLVFPLINNKGDFLGVLEIGYKAFKDVYTKEEVDIFRDFADFLEGHLKYIEIYSEINDLNINLDRKVDEKTIEYNQLLNKQTEFISMASHEIKSPIGSCIFQLDYILDEIKDGEMSIKSLEKELQILNNTFIKVGNLTNKIFAVQKYDLDKIILYKQNINFSEYLNDILFLFGKINKNLKLKIDIDNKIGFLDIDKIQFTQVIDNLLNNALKFSNKKEPKLYFRLKNEGKNICIEIEDNGKGFEDLEYEIIFEKYTSGNTTSGGIGLGLYLCKSIVEMHGGSIKAKNGNKLGGAKFIIIIPKKNN